MLEKKIILGTQIIPILSLITLTHGCPLIQQY